MAKCSRCGRNLRGGTCPFCGIATRGAVPIGGFLEGAAKQAGYKGYGRQKETPTITTSLKEWKKSMSAQTTGNPLVFWLVRIITAILLVTQAFFPFLNWVTSTILIIAVIGIIVLLIILPRFIPVLAIFSKTIANVASSVLIVMIAFAAIGFLGSPNYYQVLSIKFGSLAANASFLILVGLGLLMMGMTKSPFSYILVSGIFILFLFILLPLGLASANVYGICLNIPYFSQYCHAREVYVEEIKTVKIPVGGGIGLKFGTEETDWQPASTLYAGEPYEFSFTLTNYYEEPIRFDLTPSMLSSYGSKINFIQGYTPRKYVLISDENYPDSVKMDPEKMTVDEGNSCPYNSLQISKAQNIKIEDVTCANDRPCEGKDKTCRGTPYDCNHYTTSSSCVAANCAWVAQDQSCYGTPYPCSHYTTSSSCLDSGCTISSNFACVKIGNFECNCADWTLATCSKNPVKAKVKVTHTGFFRGNGELFYSAEMATPKPAYEFTQGPLSVIIEFQPNPYIASIHQYREDVSMYVTFKNRGGTIVIKDFEVTPQNAVVHTIDKEKGVELVEEVGTQIISCRDIGEIIPSGILPSGEEASGKLCTLKPPSIKTTLKNLNQNQVSEVNEVTYDKLNNYCNKQPDSSGTSIWDKIYQAVGSSGTCDILNDKKSEENPTIESSMAHTEVILEFSYDRETIFQSNDIIPYTRTEECRALEESTK